MLHLFFSVHFLTYVHPSSFDAQEWCEKQLEFDLCLGKKRVTKAMKAGIARHTELEEEVKDILQLVDYQSLFKC